MDLRELTVEWLKEHGYDGLWNGDHCGCFLFDLMPCEQPCQSCEPGYAQVVEGDGVPCEGIGPEKHHEAEDLRELVATLAVEARGEGAADFYSAEMVAWRKGGE